MATTTTKKLIIVVDGGSASDMATCWNVIVEDYLQKIVRKFCSHGSTQQLEEPIGAVAELGLLYCRTRKDDNGHVTRSMGWTTDTKQFLGWLSDLEFDVDDGPASSCNIAEGLADALVMFLTDLSEDDEQHYYLGQRHCILVAGNTSPFGSVDLSEVDHATLEISSDEAGQEVTTHAELIAKLFVKFVVSLSVISPRQLPVLRKIYNAANCNCNSPDSSWYSYKNPHFLVLLSENFLEARDALNEHEAPDLDVDFSEEDALLLDQILNEPSTSQISTAAETIRMETEERRGFASPDVQQRLSLIPQQCFYRTLPTSLPYAGNFGPQEMTTENTTVPRAIVLTQNAKPLNTAFVNPSIIVRSCDQASEHTRPVPGNGFSIGVHSTFLTNHQRDHEPIWGSILNSESRIGTPQHPKTPKSFASEPITTRNLINFQHVETKTMGKRKQESTESLVLPTVSADALTMRAPNFADPVAFSLLENFKAPRASPFTPMYSPMESPQDTMLLSKVNSEAILGFPPFAQNIAGFMPTICNVSGNLRAPQHFASPQSSIVLDYPQLRDSQDYQTHKEQQGIGYSWSQMNGIAQASTSSVMSRLVPMAEMPRVDEEIEDDSTILADAVNGNLHEHGRYVRTWEGGISALLAGRVTSISRVVVTNSNINSISDSGKSRIEEASKYSERGGRLHDHVLTFGRPWDQQSFWTTVGHAYKSASTTIHLTADWPRTLQLGRLLCQDFFERFPKPGPKYYLIFKATNNHSVFEHLKSRKLCSNIKLPSQTMIFSPTSKDCCFIATLFPGDFPIYRSKAPGLRSLKVLCQQEEQDEKQKQEQQKD